MMASRTCTVLGGAALVALVVFSGCATTKQPALTGAKILPARLAPGEGGVISVTVVDPQGIVAVVTATVREYPEISYDLNDAKADGDEVPGDGVWTFAIEVPGGAPPGQYNWYFEAYDTGGNLIKVTTETGETVTLTAEASVEIVF
jgi:hypothetical protein